jgi:hypothetical protein
MVYNASGSVVSDPATLEIFVASIITQQPGDVAVTPGGSASFSVVASSSSPIAYQWRKHGVPIPGATGPCYTITVVAREDDGIYDVALTDAVGTIFSEPARLAVLINPAPVNFSRTNYVIRGQNLTLSIEADGTLPMTYRWRLGSTPVFEETRDSLTGFYTLTNVQPEDDNARYTVILLNAANPTSGRLAGPMYVAVLEDRDGDGMDDNYESDNGFDPDQGADGALDEDGDGVSNRDEYAAGTDPNDENSYLRVEDVALTGLVNIEFRAEANKTYSVQYKDELDDSVWKTLPGGDVAAGDTARVVTLQDAPGLAERYYRLATPRQE